MFHATKGLSGWIVASLIVLALFSVRAYAALTPIQPGVISGCVYSSSPPTLSDGQTTPCLTDASGNEKFAAPAPTAVSTAGIIPVKSAVLESNHVIKASTGNLYRFGITTGATSGWLLLFNGTTAPAAGGAAVAPEKCFLVPANATFSGDDSGGGPPENFSIGIVLVFSSSGCLTNTASATVFLWGDAS